MTISQNGNSVTPDSREESDAMCFFSCVHDALSLTPSWPCELLSKTA